MEKNAINVKNVGKSFVVPYPLGHMEKFNIYGSKGCGEAVSHSSCVAGRLQEVLSLTACKELHHANNHVN